jgi:8-oxo-dGTP pyrophosphatase MutT (NUDIX family)
VREAEHAILSCGFVVVRQTSQGWRTLMLRAYSNWDFPKGVSEAGEPPLVTARREVAEETAITVLHLDWGERFIDSGPYDRGKVSRYFLARTEQQQIVMGIAPELGRPEHQEYRWVNFDTAHDLATARVREVIRWARQVVGA